MVDDHAVIEETIEQCVLADRMGFDTVWFVEHHFLTSFSRSIAIHAAAGVDELQFLMATETVPHDTAMSSIEMFGTHVIPELRRRAG